MPVDENANVVPPNPMFANIVCGCGASFPVLHYEDVLNEETGEYERRPVDWDEAATVRAYYEHLPACPAGESAPPEALNAEAGPESGNLFTRIINVFR